MIHKAKPGENGSLNLSTVFLEPLRVGLLVERSFRNSERLFVGVFLVSSQVKAVSSKKEKGRHKARSLITVDERMVLYDSVCVGGSQIEERWLSVCEEILRAPQSRFKKCVVSNSGATSV